ncbi:MAG: hypothetical protein WCB04_08190, partial [Mycobacteriales bacterium]
AGAAFDNRLPELYSGDGADLVPRPVPYPAACRPQAWAAAAAVSVLRDLVGLDVDVPAGVVRIGPMPGAPAGALNVRDLMVDGVRLDVAIDRAGEVTGVNTSSSLRIESGPAGS